MPLGIGIGVSPVFQSNAAGGIAFEFTSGVADPRLSYTGQNGTVFNSAGVLVSCPTNQPRLDYEPVTLAPRGLLIENPQSNLVPYGNNLDNASAPGWVASSATAVAGQAAPNGTTEAVLYTESGSAAVLRTGNLMTVAAGAAYILPFFVKRGNFDWFRVLVGDSNAFANNASGWFNLASGSTGAVAVAGSGFATPTIGIVPINNGYYRPWIRVVAPSTSLSLRFQSAASDGNAARADIGSGAGVGCQAALWGAMTAQGDLLQSYIPTTGASVTRAADAAGLNPASYATCLPANPTAMTIYAEFEVQALVSGTVQRLLQISNGTTAERLLISKGIGASGFSASIQTGGASGGTGIAPVSPGGAIKLAAAFAANDIALCVNGGTVQTYTGIGMPVGLTQMGIGSSFYNVGEPLQGWIKGLTVNPSARLPNAQLQAMTS